MGELRLENSHSFVLADHLAIQKFRITKMVVSDSYGFPDFPRSLGKTPPGQLPPNRQIALTVMDFGVWLPGKPPVSYQKNPICPSG
jgi:hypothetical protein